MAYLVLSTYYCVNFSSLTHPDQPHLLYFSGDDDEKHGYLQREAASVTQANKQTKGNSSHGTHYKHKEKHK